MEEGWTVDDGRERWGCVGKWFKVLKCGFYAVCHCIKKPNAIPPANIEATETILETENADMPLMPCPEVHPPASLAPNTIAKPPAKPEISEIWLTTKLAAIDLEVGIAQAPRRMPRAKDMFLVDGRGVFWDSARLIEESQARQKYCAISA